MVDAQNMTSLGWEFWLPLVATTGLVSACWTSLWTWFAEGRSSKKERTNTALRAAIALERYAIHAWPGTYSGPQHFKETGQPWFDEVPEIEGLPDDAAWKDVRADLTDEVLSFKNKISVAQIEAGHAARYEGNQFDFESSANALGKAAWLLAERLRREYRLPQQRELRARMKDFLA